MSVYTIPSTESFADTLAYFVDELAIKENCPLSRIKIYLPTKRAIRTVKDGFLRQSKGAPRILPQLLAIGDGDDEALSFSLETGSDIPPAISPMRRQIVLARLLERAWEQDYNYVQALTLAADLGRLIDQIHTADITIDRLGTLIDIREFSEHWTITLDFLNLVLGKLWPEYLAAEGMIDPGLYRRLHIQKLTRHYQSNPPSDPVFIAGSTGSLPATQDFIKAIALLENGYVFLPSLDTVMGESDWMHVAEGHPQYHLKNLLLSARMTPKDVRIYSRKPAHYDRSFTISQIMRPADTTEQWQGLANDSDRLKIKQGLSHLTEISCEHEDAEARAIAIAMTEIAHDPNQMKTCALITPDRMLAARVRSNLSQWGIKVDDSAGTPLASTAIGRFGLSVLGMEEKGVLKPVPFLSALKNKYAGGGSLSPTFRSELRGFEKAYLRGVRPSCSLSEIKDKGESHHQFIDTLTDLMAPLTALNEGEHTLTKWITAHLTVMENLASTKENSGASRLWIGHEGEALAEFFENLRDNGAQCPPLDQATYHGLIESMMQPVSVRPPYGTHPRLFILGQIEARMVQADRIILAGLNEGTWPPETGFDAFLSRPMRVDFGLPSLEQKISLAAHDFETALGADDVFITYSKRKGGSPALPARWIQRLETLLTAIEDKDHKIERPSSRGEQYKQWAETLRHLNLESTAISRPAPAPAADKRPTTYSVTDIEKWMRDPYFIYAKRILNLHKMDSVDMDVTARDKGNLIHEAMEEFTKSYPHALPENALSELLAIGQRVFDAESDTPEIHGLWWPRFVKAATWAAAHEKTWRTDTVHITAEDECRLPLTIHGKDYILKGKADRVEERADGSYAIIDYKTGGVPAKGDIALGVANQLPLEGYILQEGYFHTVKPAADTPISLHYWKLSGAGEGGEASEAQSTKNKVSYAQLISEAKTGLHSLLSAFAWSDTPYLASPDPDLMIREEHNDYAHLERIKEWSVTDNGEDAA